MRTRKMSDDDYDDRRRDKFRGERNDRRDRYDDDRGRDRYGRDERRDYRRDSDRYERDSKRRRSPDSESYQRGGSQRDSKRSRNDYDAPHGGGYRGGHNSDYHGGGRHSWGGNNFHQREHGRPNFNQGPPGGAPVNEDDILLSFKNWVMKQDDNINEDDACKNYKVYKTEFKKKSMQEFFISHKDEEWFRDKYHPDASEERNDQFKEAFDSSLLDITKESDIISFLETAVMLMEGATEEDVKLIQSAPIKLETENGAKESASSEMDTDENNERKRDKFSCHKDGSDDEASEKDDTDKKRKASKDSNGDSGDVIKGEKTSEDQGPESGIDDNDGEEGEVNDPNDELEQRRQEALKRAQSKYSSIFMRSLPPTISRQDISNMCKKFDGFIRVAFSHPQDERFYRRCWVTFDHSVNIKDICWNLNNIRLKDVELNPVVNRDLTRRCRPMSSLANHNVIMRHDLSLIIKIIERFDQKFGLYPEGQRNELIEKAEKYMEENLVNDEKGTDEIPLNYDKELAKIVDLLTPYLRLVHSVDYYNHSEYRNEDEMPNRCGIIHVRGEPPSNPIMRFEMNDYMKKFSEKVTNMLAEGSKLGDEETAALGKKEEEEEVKKFIEVNTQQPAPEKYLCPLSGKKFKGPEFVKKHILAKHAEKVEAVRKEVNFFNNYLEDPRRPADPVQSTQPFRPPIGFGGPGNERPPPRHMPDRSDRSFNSRPIVTYQDLDAPDNDVDLF